MGKAHSVDEATAPLGSVIFATRRAQFCRQHSPTVPAVAMGALIFIGATALFLLIPVNLAQIAAQAGAAAPIAPAFNGSLVSLGQGAGAVLGGQLTDTFGAAVMGVGGAALALSGLVVALYPNWKRSKTEPQSRRGGPPSGDETMAVTLDAGEKAQFIRLPNMQTDHGERIRVT